MTAPPPPPPPNMATLTASIERSLRNCSLNQTNTNTLLHPSTSAGTLLDLNSTASLPYHWEQCLDLQTGEIYYKNWRNGMKAKEDPRLHTTTGYSTEEEEEEEEEEQEEEEVEDEDEEGDEEDENDEEEEELYDSEGSSTSNSYGGMIEMSRNPQLHPENVLVVAGCKSCLMYYMVPKQLLDCPKCTAQLLHFDRPDRD